MVELAKMTGGEQGGGRRSWKRPAGTERGVDLVARGEALSCCCCSSEPRGRPPRSAAVVPCPDTPSFASLASASFASDGRFSRFLKGRPGLRECERPSRGRASACPEAAGKGSARCACDDIC